jgi:hypothetical protein
MMTNRSSLSLVLLGSAVLVGSLSACSAGDVSSPRTGGSNSSGNGGNTSGTGGTGASGSFGAGGTTANGGSFGAGGTTANGGSFGAGGTTGTGGTPGTGAGGTTASGGGFGTGAGGTSGGIIGAGGTAGAGGTPATGAGGTGSPPVGTDSTFATNGFGMVTAGAGVWQGYLYTATYGTGAIMPVCPTPCFMGTMKQLCVNGTVPADPTYNSGALLGWNIAQPMTATVGTTVATSGTGITLSFAGSVAGFRVSVLDALTPATEWCYTVPTTATATVSIPWASLTTNCSDTSKPMTPYAVGTPIQKLQITVPTNPATATPFNFCLVSVAVQ